MLQQAIINNGLYIPAADGIQAAGLNEMENAVSVIMLAFSNDPVARWVYPDAADYLRYFPNFIRSFTGGAFRHGSAYATNGFSGAALWLPPGVHPDDNAITGLFESTVADDIKEDLFNVFEAMSTYHPDGPHWYLPMIGVDPHHQGKGIGGELMRYALERSDRDGLPAYLESSNPRNISLYERCGFVSLGTIQFGRSAPVYPMVRWPK